MKPSRLLPMARVAKLRPALATATTPDRCALPGAAAKPL
jgi:hypothetical protein